ncbi:MAG: hypothetical protein OXG72_16655 [Acidobacteria bacterium]|nr:hypothetical protein [Acidobacteriota bacterium]
MTLAISRCIDQIVAIQRGLRITSPVELQTANAVRYTLEAGLPDTPLWANTWKLPRLSESAGNREANFTVVMSCYAEDSDPDLAAQIATAFWEVAMDEFAKHTTLNGTCQLAQVIARDNGPHVARVTGRTLLGVTILLDVLIQDFPTYG